jgi:hypothetical protein
MKKPLLYSFFAFATFLVFTSGIEDNNGKAGRTGSPNEQTCYNGCHSSYALNSGPAVIEITSNIPNWEYTPGQSYTINVTATQSGINLYGIGFEALTDANQNGGTLIAGTGTQIKNATVGGVSRKNIVHTLGGGASTGSHTFTFTWTAPAAGTGNVTFYWASVAANGNNSNSGDYVYTRTQTVTEYVAPSATANLPNNFNLTVYPIPATTHLNIDFNLQEEETISASIYSLEGALVKNLFTETPSSGTQHYMADISSLAKGIYVLKLSGGNKSTSKKIVVQ